MGAMRECIGGLYGSTYWISLGYLAVYAAAFLILFINAVLQSRSSKIISGIE